VIKDEVVVGCIVVTGVVIIVHSVDINSFDVVCIVTVDKTVAKANSERENWSVSTNNRNLLDELCTCLSVENTDEEVISEEIIVGRIVVICVVAMAAVDFVRTVEIITKNKSVY
jgi:hypothetical protein